MTPKEREQAAVVILEAVTYVHQQDMNSDLQRILIGKILAIWESLEK